MSGTEWNGPRGEPGPEPDTTTAAEPDDPGSSGEEALVDGSGDDGPTS